MLTISPFIFNSLNNKNLSVPIPGLILVHHRVVPCRLGHHSRHSLPLHTHHTSLLRHHPGRLSHHASLLRHHTRRAVIASTDWTKGIILACYPDVSPHRTCSSVIRGRFPLHTSCLRLLFLWFTKVRLLHSRKDVGGRKLVRGLLRLLRLRRGHGGDCVECGLLLLLLGETSEVYGRLMHHSQEFRRLGHIKKKKGNICHSLGCIPI